MTKDQYLTLCRTAFPDIYSWVRNWIEHQRDLMRTPDNERFFEGNSSYMDLGELLRKNENDESSPCVIFDTDIHALIDIDLDTITHTHTLYFCVLSEDFHDGKAIKRAKDYASHLATVFVSFYRDCRHVNNATLKRTTLTRIKLDSTTPFLNGWQAVAISITTTDHMPCGMAEEYSL